MGRGEGESELIFVLPAVSDEDLCAGGADERVIIGARLRIAGKIALGIWPGSQRFITSASFRVGWGPARHCSGCEEPISDSEMYVELARAGRMLRFREPCERIWEEELRSLAPSWHRGGV